MVGGTGNIASDDWGGSSQPVPAPVVAVPATGDATGDPLHNFTDITAAVQAVANSALGAATTVAGRALCEPAGGSPEASQLADQPASQLSSSPPPTLRSCLCSSSGA